MSTCITREQLEIDRRVSHTAKLFGLQFPLRFEPFVYAVTSRLAAEYHGGYWQFYTLSNGGFYMAPHADQLFRVSCDNGFEGDLSADALGIAACLYAYSQLRQHTRNITIVLIRNSHPKELLMHYPLLQTPPRCSLSAAPAMPHVPGSTAEVHHG